MMCFQVLFLGICLGCWQPVEEPQITISQVWSPPANARTVGVGLHLTIDNAGGAADRLLSASAKVCSGIEFGQTHFELSGPNQLKLAVSRESSIEIPAKGSAEFKPNRLSVGSTAEFQPDGYFAELVYLTKPLAPGDTFAVTLKFEKSGTMQVISEVRGVHDYLEKGGYDRAIADYAEAIRLDSKEPYLYRGRGAAYADMCKFDKAIADYTEAIRLHPKDPFAYLLRGVEYADMGYFDKAIADYNEAIRLERMCAYLARINRAYAYHLKGEYDETIADLTEVIRLDPDDAGGWYYSALLRLASGEVDAYRSECASMLEHFGQTRSGKAAYLTAWACALSPDATADYSNAVALAERALDSDPKSIRYLQTLGAILYRAGRLEEAVERLTAASEMMEEPDSSSQSSPAYTWYFVATAHRPGLGLQSSPAYTWFFLAMAHHANEQPEEAKKWLGRAVEHKEGTARLPWNRRLTLKLLREEAETLLKSTDQIEKPKIPGNGEEEARKLR